MEEEQYLYTATPSHNIEFMHNLRPLTEYSEEVLVEKLLEKTKAFRYNQYKLTGESYPYTTVLPEVKWEISRKVKVQK